MEVDESDLMDWRTSSFFGFLDLDAVVESPFEDDFLFPGPSSESGKKRAAAKEELEASEASEARSNKMRSVVVEGDPEVLPSFRQNTLLNAHLALCEQAAQREKGIREQIQMSYSQQKHAKVDPSSWAQIQSSLSAYEAFLHQRFAFLVVISFCQFALKLFFPPTFFFCC